MDKRIIYKRDDGGVSVIVSTGVLSVEETANKDVPTGKHYKIVDVSEIPSDRTFRNAWEMVSEKISTNMDKAREIARENVRRARAPKLAELDSAYLRADERQDQAEKQAIITKKQALRDAPSDPRIDSASDEAALKAAMEAVQREIEA